MKTINHKEMYEKLTKAFMEAFRTYEEQGGDLRNLCWNHFDEVFHEMFPDPDERLKIENVDKAWETFKSKHQKNNYSHSTLNSKLLDACVKGSLKEVKELVNLGADIHTEREGALWCAAEHGHLEVVEYLVGLGADIHCHNDYALYAASDGGHLKTVEYLIKVGANVNARDGYALYEAARQGYLDVVKCLVENGARMNKAVCSIAEFNNPKIIDYLEQI